MQVQHAYYDGMMGGAGAECPGDHGALVPSSPSWGQQLPAQQVTVPPPRPPPLLSAWPGLARCGSAPHQTWLSGVSCVLCEGETRVIVEGETYPLVVKV